MKTIEQNKLKGATILLEEFLYAMDTTITSAALEDNGSTPLEDYVRFEEACELYNNGRELTYQETLKLIEGVDLEIEGYYVQDDMTMAEIYLLLNDLYTNYDLGECCVGMVGNKEINFSDYRNEYSHLSREELMSILTSVIEFKMDLE